ncbi:TPA: acetamidase [Candidatus Poribacteria bacterium]|nr:acetamidase [Candidatus Poribacteria bacterium]
MRYIVSDEHRVYEMSPSNPPALEVPTGTELTFITRDCFDGQVDWSRFPESLDEIDRSRTNPATGPVAIEGARPGDTLCVEILDVKVDERGFANGVAFQISHGEAILPGGLRMPIKPVIGVIGVSPAEGSIRNSTPGDHGGNLDTKEVTTGSKVYLPVWVEGALLAMGDIHALQGDGEVCGQGIEIGGRVTIRVNLVDLDLPRKPVVETSSHICIITAAETLDRAADDIVRLTRGWLARRLGISEREAFALLSTLCDLEISQIVNPLKAVKMCIPKDLLRFA